MLWFFTNSVLSQNNKAHEVYFDTDSYEIPSTERNRLLLFLTKIDSLKIEKITIYGFCDDRGTDDYNMTLSQQRADAIKSIFVTNQINDSLITNVDGKGEILLKIVKETNLEKIRGLNRKVEIVVTPVVKKIKNEPTLEQKLKGELKVGEKIVLDKILFRQDYAYLMPKSKKTLDQIAKILLEREDVYFTIQGHVCCTPFGRDAIDKKTKKRNLSVARAKYIYDYLAKKGVRRSRMKYEGLRHKFPLGGKPEDDRRVEILITEIKE